jgi:hypothetical protein
LIPSMKASLLAIWYPAGLQVSESFLAHSVELARSGLIGRPMKSIPISKPSCSIGIDDLGSVLMMAGISSAGSVGSWSC